MSAEGAGAGPDLAETARLLGAYSWVEQRLFEILGAAAATSAPGQLTVLFDAASQQHAWHAALFAERIPVVASLPAPQELLACPSAAVQSAMDRLAQAPSPLAALAVVARVVLPRLVSGYRGHLAGARPLSDPPVVRALGLVVRDEVDELLDSEALLQRLLSESADGAAGAAMAEAQGAEAALVEAGPGLVR